MKKLAVAAALATAAMPASAVVVMGGLTGGSPGVTFSIVAPPANVPATVTSPTVLAFNEGIGTVATAINVPRGAVSTIPAGTRVYSHFISFAVTESSSNLQAIGSVKFDRPILGVITTANQLGLSNYLGAPGTTYTETPQWGIEWSDLNVNGSRTGTSVVGSTLYFDWITNGAGPDSVRVLTLVPEASTWAMLIAGFGLVGFASRRRRTAVAA